MKIKKIALLLTMVILFIAISNISSASSNENKTISVMSRNLYIGTDLGPMINASNQTVLVEAIMTVFTEFQATDFPTRAKALATEIATKQPDLIGLQEAVLIRSQYPSDLSPIPDATTIEMDFLATLLTELTIRGQEYEVVAETNGFDVEVPGLLPDGSCCRDLRLTDREVILARKNPDDMNLSNIKEENFNNNLIIPFLDRNFTMLYGWASADVEVQGKSFRFVTTHLEPNSFAVQAAQANEILLGPANTTLPVVLVCDCNSNENGTGTYGNLITAGFEDAWNQTNPNDPGFTCCQDGNLLNNDSNLSERIDLVLFQNGFYAIDSGIVGANKSDRILSPSGLYLWPSDHAGIVAKLAFSIRKQIDINITGVPVVGKSTKNILAADYRNFTAGDPYNITIVRISNSMEVFAEKGILTGGPKQTIPIGWKPHDKGNYLLVAKGDTISVSNKVMVIDSEVVSPVPELSSFVFMSIGLLGLFGLIRKES
jgi:endonuclease/exonuclease/phosphatase family metal-dependent hydrolase